MKCSSDAGVENNYGLLVVRFHFRRGCDVTLCVRARACARACVLVRVCVW